MKKWFSILLVFIITLIPVVSQAAHAPLVVRNKRAYVPDESNVELVSYNAFIRIRTGISYATTSLVLKNQDMEESTTFRMGMPVQFDSVSRVRDLSVNSDGDTIRVTQRSALKNPPTEQTVDISKWYVWDISLEPGESKVVECSFTFDNKLELDGTEVISYPLELLEHWHGKVENIQIVADLDFYGPYVFNPISPVTPNQYDEGGRLSYRWDSYQSVPSTFELSFKPMDNVITKYIQSESESNKEIESILQAYKNRSYFKTINLIHEFLANAEDVLLLPELKYLEALCYQNLSEMDKALNLFDQLESNPGFGDSLSNVIRNKIIYDKTNIYKNQTEGDKKALEYLISLGDLETNNYVFSLWLEKEISLLTPPPELEESPEEAPDAAEEEEIDNPEGDDPKVIDKIVIGDYELYIEDFLIIALIIIIIIFIIVTIIRRKRRRRRSSLFRY
ncbi:MAG: hypothetical protein ACOX77_03655 [Caldicoprobacterales bacterium]|jgi:tetratricopeptide (TPR) repeat protein